MPLTDVIPILISVASLLLSGYAIWVAQFNHGRLKTTQPTLLCMKREFPSARPKIFLRTCLFTTGTKGRVIENMFLKVRQRKETFQGTYRFDFWGHTENGKLTLGSGLFVGPNGVASDHHFNPRANSGDDFLFIDGEYLIEVFAAVVGRRKVEKLLSLTFTVNSLQAAELIQIPTRELYLFWNVDTRSYDGHVRHDNKSLDEKAIGIAVHEALANLSGPPFQDDDVAPG
ncbi:MAG: hypothetical protein ABSG25_01335 [Bryobacteraceae bacterium]